ncbi:MAG: hypothetical protein MJZ33_05000 [Paludibacteraceae bacterium]|nr:hypothetical protein [Paludibacteraceae bacterium]
MTTRGCSPVIVGQKGAIENANELIHQYIPKEMELNSISDEKLAFIVA